MPRKVSPPAHGHEHNPLERIEEKLEQLESTVDGFKDELDELSGKLDQVLGILTEEEPAVSATLQIIPNN
jgi:prefoldin subunit 5